MILVVQQPPGGAEPQVWFAFDPADLLGKVALADPLPLWQIHDAISPRELLEMAGATPETPEVQQAHPTLWALGAAHGWDTLLYRADHLLGPGTYRAQPVSEAQAALAALQARGGECRVFWSAAEAMAAFERLADPFWAGAGWRARWALRSQLVALEVLADDL